MILHAQYLFADHGLHGHVVIDHGIGGVELVGDSGVVGVGHANANSGLHEAGEGGEDIGGGNMPLV